MNTDAEKVQRARELISARRYDEARALLQTIDHPTAREWLAKLDQLAAQNAAQNAPQYGAPPALGSAQQPYGAPQYGTPPVQPQPYAGYTNMPGALPANMPISDDTGGKAGASFLLLLTGLVGGLVGAALGGVIWVGIAAATGLESGYMAIGVGLLAGLGVLLLSFGQRAIPFRILAVIIGIVGVVLGKYFIFIWSEGGFIHQTLNGQFVGAFVRAALNPDLLRAFPQSIGQYFSDPRDFLYLALAALAAWAVLTPRRRRKRLM